MTSLGRRDDTGKRLARYVHRGGVIMLLAVSLMTLGCVSLPEEPDPNALNTPVYLPVANAETVIVEVVSVNGQEAPEEAFRNAFEKFRDYLPGELQIVVGEPAEFDLGKDGALTKAQLRSVIEGRMHRGPSVVTLVLCPALEFFDGAGKRTLNVLDTGEIRHYIQINARRVAMLDVAADTSTHERAWEFALLHELCHTFNLPSEHAHRWQGSHCTRPACILFPLDGERSVRTTSYQADAAFQLCRKCRRELSRAQNEAEGALFRVSDSYTPLDLLDGLIDRNPEVPTLYARRAEVYMRMDDAAAAVRDYETALTCEEGDWFLMQKLARVLAVATDTSVQDLPRALALATQACDLTEWEEHRALDTLALVHVQLGDIDTAIRYERQAVKLAPAQFKVIYRERLKHWEERKP